MAKERGENEYPDNKDIDDEAAPIAERAEIEFALKGRYRPKYRRKKPTDLVKDAIEEEG